MTNKKIPLRKCVGCQEEKSKKDLIRVIKTPEEDVLLDTTGRKNGRGAYICPNRDGLVKAMKSKALERSLKTSIPDEIFEALKKEMDNFAK